MARSHKNTTRLTNKERAWAAVAEIADVVSLIGSQKTAITRIVQRTIRAAVRQALARDDRRDAKR